MDTHGWEAMSGKRNEDNTQETRLISDGPDSYLENGLKHKNEHHPLTVEEWF